MYSNDTTHTQSVSFIAPLIQTDTLPTTFAPSGDPLTKISEGHTEHIEASFITFSNGKEKLQCHLGCAVEDYVLKSL